jgi:hypothetical protein
MASFRYDDREAGLNFSNSHRPLRLVAAAIVVLAGGACLGAAAAPRVLAIDNTTLQVHPASERRQEIEQSVQAWKLAWELGEADTYLRFYDPRFRGQAGSRLAWEKQRRARLVHRKISVEVQDLRIRVLSDNEAEVRFLQHYSSAAHGDAGEKRLRMRRDGGAWRITEELWTARR